MDSCFSDENRIKLEEENAKILSICRDIKKW